MRFLRLSCLFFAFLAPLKASAQDTLDHALHEVTVSDEIVTASEGSTVPEPSSTFFAGIGGLAFLLFVLRRKNVRAS